MPSVTSPSLISSSDALIRGLPSARSVASVLLVPAANRERTRSANSGASFAISCQVDMRRYYPNY